MTTGLIQKDKTSALAIQRKMLQALAATLKGKPYGVHPRSLQAFREAADLGWPALEAAVVDRAGLTYDQGGATARSCSRVRGELERMGWITTHIAEGWVGRPRSWRPTLKGLDVLRALEAPWRALPAAQVSLLVDALDRVIASAPPPPSPEQRPLPEARDVDPVPMSAAPADAFNDELAELAGQLDLVDWLNDR